MENFTVIFENKTYVFYSVVTGLIAVIICTIIGRTKIPVSNGSSYFKPSKSLNFQDELFLTMLANESGNAHGGASYCITDPDLPDNPIVYASPGFCSMTGYSKGDVEGRNCKFLQGDETNKEDVAKIRQAIENMKEENVRLLNYRKDGTKFINQFNIRPLFDERQRVAYFIGVQAQISATDSSPRKEKINPGAKISSFLPTGSD